MIRGFPGRHCNLSIKSRSAVCLYFAERRGKPAYPQLRSLAKFGEFDVPPGRRTHCLDLLPGLLSQHFDRLPPHFQIPFSPRLINISEMQPVSRRRRLVTACRSPASASCPRPLGHPVYPLTPLNPSTACPSLPSMSIHPPLFPNPSPRKLRVLVQRF
ncbi:hypothetical protein CDEST_11338 [Colletotrichum destructivum]|uniref:Uncharacterized protein n=1 Tax=Colletotrichum destructivum TaxID=34406 RepID=A0AAX4ISW2_9PEZI|nr:hypothetical protein CDEST_11338 [Colletotrichum destructivum]